MILITYSQKFNSYICIPTYYFFMQKACTVSWRPVISEIIDMKSKELLESQKPVTVSSKSANRQLQRIARSLVTSVLASAMATLLTTHGNVSTRQVSLSNQFCLSYTYLKILDIL